MRLLCRLGRHRWVQASTESGDRYLRCDRCGTDEGSPSLETDGPGYWAVG